MTEALRKKHPENHKLSSLEIEEHIFLANLKGNGVLPQTGTVPSIYTIHKILELSDQNPEIIAHVFTPQRVLSAKLSQVLGDSLTQFHKDNGIPIKAFNSRVEHPYAVREIDQDGLHNHWLSVQLATVQMLKGLTDFVVEPKKQKDNGPTTGATNQHHADFIRNILTDSDFSKEKKALNQVVSSLYFSLEDEAFGVVSEPFKETFLSQRKKEILDSPDLYPAGVVGERARLLRQGLEYLVDHLYQDCEDVIVIPRENLVSILRIGMVARPTSKY